MERSTNGSSFSEIAQVGAKGSNSSYQFDDQTVNATGANRLYYRIRQVDVNGASSTTDVVEVVLDGKLGLNGIYPNPADEFVTLKLDAVDIDSITITISDGAGRLVFVEERLINQQDELKIDVSKLAIGFYVIRVNDGVNSASARFQIMRYVVSPGVLAESPESVVRSLFYNFDLLTSDFRLLCI
ncbi:MAG: T9SS type A sorting domain-containing protein [Bacteroidia bacterium]